MSDREKRIQAVQFSSFPDESASLRQHRPLEMLMDIPLELTVELGRTEMRVEDLLSLKPGSIIVVTKLAGEPVDVIVNDHRIASGEVVVLDDNFGVRITGIVNPEDRLHPSK